MKIVEKTWGREEIVYADQHYTCKKLVYTRPIASSFHCHHVKHETFVIASGQFSIRVGEDELRMYPGDSAVIPPNTYHRVQCLIPGTIIEASTFDDPADCHRLIPSEA